MSNNLRMDVNCKITNNSKANQPSSNNLRMDVNCKSIALMTYTDGKK